MSNSTAPCLSCGGPTLRHRWLCVTCASSQRRLDAVAPPAAIFSGHGWSSFVLADVYWQRAGRPDDRGCWPWAGSRHKISGYGVACLYKAPHRYGLGRCDTAHRLAWVVHCGPLAPGRCVLHHCDNPPCVNPDHLFLGSLADNAFDRDRKGRTARGECVGRPTALTRQSVVAIRGAYATGDTTYSRLAERFGVSISQVHRVVKREQWQYVL